MSVLKTIFLASLIISGLVLGLSLRAYAISEKFGMKWGIRKDGK